jgi:hypothetical protein
MSEAWYNQTTMAYNSVYLTRGGDARNCAMAVLVLG